MRLYVSAAQRLYRRVGGYCDRGGIAAGSLEDAIRVAFRLGAE
jgi:hypothetical protein